MLPNLFIAIAILLMYSVRQLKGFYAAVGLNRPIRLLSISENIKLSDKANSHIITPRSKDYSAWYNDILAQSDMVDQSPVRGCMVIKPWGMGVWDLIRGDIDNRIRDTGTQNAYFPLLIPKSFLAKEAEHVDGFAKECAVVTHHRLCVAANGKELIPDPAAQLEEPLVIRPTSETIIWNMFKKWVHSYRDLPLKVNQWANVVRWEMRTRPFLRTSEFLWQEGHTAHATNKEAEDFSRQILDMYANMCEELLALPVVKGEKSPSERFAGAVSTFTIEAMMQNGWALQSGTSHYLGENFAKAFDVLFQSDTGERKLVAATSWGVSTRLIGAMLMAHSDDKGVILPPKVAPVQVVIVPIFTGSDSKNLAVSELSTTVLNQLRKRSIRALFDDRPNMRHGSKYFEWERKGVPVRIEIGPRDVEKNTLTAVLRVNGEKSCIDAKCPEDFSQCIENLLSQIHATMFSKANETLQSRTYRVKTYDEMKRHIESSDVNSAGFYLVPWKCDEKNEAWIKEDCKATIRCYPFLNNLRPPTADIKCFFSGLPATHVALFGRSY